MGWVVNGFALILIVLMAATPRMIVPSTFNFLAIPAVVHPGAMWIYEGRYGAGVAPFISGTDERVDVLPPNLTVNEDPIAIALFRGPFDFRGYPMRISLVDKLFTATQKVQRAVMYTPEGVRAYENGKPAFAETELHGPGVGAFTASGPFPADGAIIEQYRASFEYAVQAMRRVSGLTAEQMDLARYAVLFIDTPSATWMEFGPAFGPNETPHLGCQTQLGRDMVFEYPKTPAGAAAVLPCF